METAMTKPFPPAPKQSTSAHVGFCTADCYPTHNPQDLSYAVVKNGAVQNHHTGPHAHEMAQAQAAGIRSWADYRDEATRIHIEEFTYDREARKYNRTATALEVV